MDGKGWALAAVAFGGGALAAQQWEKARYERGVEESMIGEPDPGMEAELEIAQQFYETGQKARKTRIALQYGLPARKRR
jgi:hypothetical protein